MRITLALLRGVNVGSHNKVPMAALRGALAEDGLPGAQTYIQSGNIAVRSGLEPEVIGARIEASILAHFGVTTSALCYTDEVWAAILAANPFPAAAEDPTRLAVLFSQAAPTPEQCARLEAAQQGEEAFRVEAGVTYLDLPNGQGRSKLAAVASTLFKADGTTRNWRTVVAMNALAAQISGRD